MPRVPKSPDSSRSPLVTRGVGGNDSFFIRSIHEDFDVQYSYSRYLSRSLPSATYLEHDGMGVIVNFGNIYDIKLLRSLGY